MFVYNVFSTCMGQRTLDQEHLDLARLQGQVVDLKSLRSNYEALLVKKTQVECERDELQKRYSEVVKKVGEMEQATEKVKNSNYILCNILKWSSSFHKCYVYMHLLGFFRKS